MADTWWASISKCDACLHVYTSFDQHNNCAAHKQCDDHPAYTRNTNCSFCMFWDNMAWDKYETSFEVYSG